MNNFFSRENGNKVQRNKGPNKAVHKVFKALFTSAFEGMTSCYVASVATGSPVSWIYYQGRRCIDKYIN
jgi:hypothetical protein